MKELLDTVKAIAEKHGIRALDRNVQAVDSLLAQSRVIDIAVLGQFKAGKSSFLNGFIGKDILPTGVIPLTSVITRICYGEKEHAAVTFFDGHAKEIKINEINEYVSETRNPENKKKVLWVDVALPDLIKYRGLRFVDTPGLGSIFKHNSEVTEKWAPEIGAAIVVISADRPLSEDEILLIKEVEKYTPDISILLTKVDLFTESQISEISSFMGEFIKKSLKTQFSIFLYSVREGRDTYNNILKNALLTPFMKDLGGEFDKIVLHKIKSLAGACQSYLELSLSVSKKSDTERTDLKAKILSERLSLSYIRKELLLLMTNYLSNTREEVSGRLMPYGNSIKAEVLNDFLNASDSWKGNLYKLSRNYESWMNKTLLEKMRRITGSEMPYFADILEDAKKHFSFFCGSFRERLDQRIQSVLGITIKNEEWVAEIREIKVPDVRISRASDFHLDLLWFLFPMFIFRGVFLKHFSRQIPYEVNTNIHRVTSDVTGIINKSIEELKDQTYRYITNELSTIENVLSNQNSRTDELENSIELLQKLIA
jgi:GTP-binding protein EngB required for normal cell division